MLCKIRSAKPRDLAALSQLAGQVQQLHAEHYPGIFKFPIDSGKVEKLFGHVIKTRGQDVLIAERDSAVVGYLWYETQRRRGSVFKWAQARLYVNHICVDQEQRGLGVGAALFSALETLARDGGYDEIALDTWFANEDAQRFFRQCGFEPQRLYLSRKLED